MTTLPATIIGPMPATPATTPPPIPESKLDPRYNEAYRMKLAGVGLQEIADKFSVDRSTLWRWLSKVKQEAQENLSDTSPINVISEMKASLEDLEQQARQAALEATSPTAKAQFLAEARRCVMAQQKLLTEPGILPKAPEQIFRVTADHRPMEMREETDPLEKFNRAEAIGMIIERMQKNVQLG